MRHKRSCFLLYKEEMGKQIKEHKEAVSKKRAYHKGYLLQHKGVSVQLEGWTVKDSTLESVLILNFLWGGELAIAL